MNFEPRGSIKTIQLESFPPNSDPMTFDLSNMAQKFGKNVTLMFGTHHDEPMPWLIVVNTVTGERIRIDFHDETTKAQWEKRGVFTDS